MSDSRDKATKKRSGTIDRRNVLLGGTTFAAASAIATGNPAQVAQAQQQPAAPSGKKPNARRISRAAKSINLGGDN
jgi:hypothetical protein